MSNKKKILVIQKVHDKGMELINNHPDFDVEVTDDVSVENLKTKIKDCDGASIRIAKLSGDVIICDDYTKKQYPQLCKAMDDLFNKNTYKRKIFYGNDRIKKRGYVCMIKI